MAAATILAEEITLAAAIPAAVIPAAVIPAAAIPAAVIPAAVIPAAVLVVPAVPVAQAVQKVFPAEDMDRAVMAQKTVTVRI